MPKRQFILFLGTGRSGTTALYKTLHLRQRYLHGGFAKETFYLMEVYRDRLLSSRNSSDFLAVNHSYETLPDKSHLLVFALNKIKDCTMNNNELLKDILDGGEINCYKENFKLSRATLRQFTEECLNKLFSHNFTIEKYIEYYRQLDEYCGDNYCAITDFSNPTFHLSKDILFEVVDKLNEYFDVKIMMIFRDPIRRLFSSLRYTDTIDFDHIFKRLPYKNYPRKVKEAYDVVGKENVCYLIMEDLFKSGERKEIEKLENFLNLKIPSMHPCTFFPNKDIINSSINDGALKKPWGSIFTAELYQKIRSTEQWNRLYDDFEDLHGFLPADWGFPIN
jgi:hypothetical protein